jgi:rhamnosyltransferase subunit B
MHSFSQPGTTNMKAIIFATGSDGEIHPHLGIGRELMARGYHVVFITTFNYVAVASECGFEVLSFLSADEDQSLLQSTECLGLIAKIKSYCRFLAGKASEICELAASRLDDQSILIAPPFFYSVAKLLHTKYSTPYISTVLVPAHLYSLKHPPSFKSTQWFSRLPYYLRKPLFRVGERLIVDPFFRMLLKEITQRLDLPQPSHVISEWWYSPQRVVGLFYDWFCPAPADWPSQVVLTGFPMFSPNAGEQQLSPGLSRFLDSGPPPVVFNPGTETQNPRKFFNVALKAAQTLGVRAVFLTRLTDHLPKLPDTIWHESYPPFHLLLPRASMLVHHGGIGTIALALRAGIPQLVLPTWTDQLDNGQRVERLGCGLVQQNSLDSVALLEKLKYLLSSPRVRDACRSAQVRMETDHTACRRAVDVIEDSFRSARRIAASIESMDGTMLETTAQGASYKGKRG